MTDEATFRLSLAKLGQGEKLNCVYMNYNASAKSAIVPVSQHVTYVQ